MRGDFVIVRAFGAIPLIRRLWDEDNNSLYITNDEQFQLLMVGKDAMNPLDSHERTFLNMTPNLPQLWKIYIKMGNGTGINLNG